MKILGKLLARMFGTQQERDMKRYIPVVTEIIEVVQPELKKLDDDRLRAKTLEFRRRYCQGASEAMAGILSGVNLGEITVVDLQKTLEEFMKADGEGRTDIYSQLPKPFALNKIPGPDRMQLDEMQKEFTKARFEVLQQLLPEAFAVCREMAERIGQPDRWNSYNVPYNRLLPHYPVQLVGGMSLFEGAISEMATGEGKTIVATLPAYLIGLTGEGVHVVTVNDYLASRDSEWMGKLFEELGLSVGVIQSDMTPEQRQEAYGADITYGTNNEFGFDYLRDNMAWAKEHCVQRGHNYAIIDEVDSILIDEARTPLIISGPTEESTDKYYVINSIIPKLKQDTHYKVDEKEHTVMLTEEGIEQAQQLLGLENMFTEENLDLIHHLNQAIRAHCLYSLDSQYIIQDGKVVIVDEFTGRLMPGRRWSDGLHQAVEAKHELRIERENQTLATITFQNYFRLYDRLAGMTGTADTEASEFMEIYTLPVRVIPTNKPLIRQILPDVVYKSEREKFEAIAEEIVDCHQRGQPVLVGTISIEISEKLSKMLSKGSYWNEQIQQAGSRIVNLLREADSGALSSCKSLLKRSIDVTEDALTEIEISIEDSNLKDNIEPILNRMRRLVRIREQVKIGVPHNILNAKHHQREAEIVAQAGRKGMITISTNMAGRGTDIVLGGNPQGIAKSMLSADEKDDVEAWEKALGQAREHCVNEQKEVLEVGGLHVLGTERHESRRIDNQLRGRCGRQGDPGSSRFFLSLEDDLMRKFGSDRIKGWAERFGMAEGEVIEHAMISKAIESAQKRVEGHHFDTRKHLLKYDNVMGKQREVVYEMRADLLAGEDPEGSLLRMVETNVEDLMESYAPPKAHSSEYDLKTLQENMLAIFGLTMDLSRFGDPDLSRAESQENREALEKQLIDSIHERFKARQEEFGEEEYKGLIRAIMLRTIDSKWKEHLYTMDHLSKSVGLRGYAQQDPLVEYEREGYDLFEKMFQSTERDIVTWTFKVQPVPEGERRPRPQLTGVRRRPMVRKPSGDSKSKTPVTVQQTSKKIGRNDPCPCGSGKKYKKCCLNSQ